MAGAVTIRDAVEADVEAISRVHVQAWRESYAGLLERRMLDGLSVERRAEMWRSALDPPRPQAKLLVAEVDGEIVGLGGAGKARPGPLGTEAEISAVYLLDRIKRQGVGRRMMAALFAHLRAHGFGSAGLWCFAQNPPARRFYEALGGIAGIEQAWELDRQRVTEIAYRFEPIPRL